MDCRHLNKDSFFGIVALILFFIVMNGIAFVGFINVWMVGQYEKEIIDNIDSLEDGHVGLVFGGGMESETEMSTMQMHRMLTALELYRAGKLEKIIVTGDDGMNRFDEVTAMRDFLIQNGVPGDSVLTDWHGYRTYESCWRAMHVFDQTEVVAISQDFHLSRIQYICESFGISTTAFSADRTNYRGWWTPYVREYLARVKAWWQVTVTRPEAQFIE